MGQAQAQLLMTQAQSKGPETIAHKQNILKRPHSHALSSTLNFNQLSQEPTSSNTPELQNNLSAIEGSGISEAIFQQRLGQFDGQQMANSSFSPVSKKAMMSPKNK